MVCYNTGTMSTPTVENEIEVPKGLPKALHRDKLAEIANYVLEGLSEDEACVLSGFSPKVFKEIKQSNEGVSMYLEKKKIEFKRKHLKIIGEKKSDKNSMWMLEALRPEEFGAKKKGNTTVNVIGAIIKDIQQSDDLLVKTQNESVAQKRGEKQLDVHSALV